MKARAENQGPLSRRLLAHYMMFGLLSIVTLAVSMLIIIKAAQAPSSGPNLLTRLSDVANRITSNFVDGGGSQVQALIDELSQDSELKFCGVLNPDGTYIAHSNPALTGRRGALNFLQNSMPGVAERVSFLREDQPGPREYWVPLRHEQQTFGMLQVRVEQEESSQLMLLFRQHFGTAVGIPVLLLLFGGTRLRGVVKASSTIEDQLARLARSSDRDEMQLQPVEDSGPAMAGWNRLVTQLEKGQVLKNLESRLNDVLGGIQTRKLEQILRQMSDGIAVTDSAGIVTFANRAFAQLLDTDETALCGLPLERALPAGNPENQQRFALHCQELSRSAVIELHASRELTDGVLRLARQPFQTDDSGLLSQLWSLRDISHQKLAEHTRDQFVDTATHELRTPLANIRACAETLELDRELDEETQKSYLNTIGSEAVRLSRFVDEFLNISRMEAGSLTLNRHPTHLDRLITEALSKTRPQFDQKHIEVHVQLPAKVPELSLDKDKISAALVNLLGNAAKYTPEGGRVSLNAELGKADVRIHVEDSGYGIAPDEVTKVFNKFFRSDDQRVRDINGTGLGLSFAQEVLQLHGGDISVRSELNKGSRFTMTLPVA